MSVQVIVLNGGSSSGKTGIARCLQAVLARPWLRLSVDDLVEALPPSLVDAGAVKRPGMAGVDLDIVDDALVDRLSLRGGHARSPVAAGDLAVGGDFRCAAHPDPQHR